MFRGVPDARVGATEGGQCRIVKFTQYDHRSRAERPGYSRIKVVKTERDGCGRAPRPSTGSKTAPAGPGDAGRTR